MLELLLLCLGSIYALIILTFAIAAARSRYPFDRMYRPTVSVIIAARNEEGTIGACLESMVKLEYSGQLEIIVVDDGSTDRTAGIVSNYARRDARIRLLPAGPPVGNLRGKANALAHGITASSGEIIMMTDADCRVPPGWVAETVKYYSDGRVGLVAGFTQLEFEDWFGGIQALDWFALLSVAAATMKLGRVTTAVGNNLSVRRSVYNAIGGYAALAFSVTEDHALVRSIAKTGRHRLLLPLDDATVVSSLPCHSAKELFLQRKRWFAGGKSLPPQTHMVFGVLYLFHGLLLLSFFLLNPVHLAAPLALKLIPDFVLLMPTARLGGGRALRYFPVYALYNVLYMLALPIAVAVSPTIRWKERTYQED